MSDRQLDQQLVERVQRGDKQAFNLLVTKYQRRLGRLVSRFVRDLAEAEDVTQEAFIKVFTNISKYTFDTIPSFSAWIKKIMVNTALNHIRSNKKNKIFDEWSENESYEQKEAETEKTTILFSQQQLLEMIQNLPDGYRTVFNLYVFEKFTHKEIAESLNISVNTSKTQLFKARKMLQVQMHKTKK